MNDIKKLSKLLKNLINILSEEKQVLIKNDPSALASIIERKNVLINKIEPFIGLTPSGDDEIRNMVLKIRELQETNLLLTKQAINFQNQFLQIVTKNNASQYVTYSSKGDICASKGINIVDQNV